MNYNKNLQDLSVKPSDYYSQNRPEMIDFIPPNAKVVLDVGCGEAWFGAQLKKKFNLDVWGIELDEAAGFEARKKIDKVYIGDIDKLIKDMPDNFFDCIVFNDVLEHLVDPFSLLLNLKSKLTANGVIVSSIPNVRYFFTLKDLLVKKQWEYEDAGILDKTHLRFFTEKSIIKMFTSLGYKVETIRGINPIKSWKFTLLNILSLGYLSDTKYMQFASVVKLK